MNKIGTLLITIGITLILSSLYIIINNHYKDINALKESQNVLTLMEEVSNKKDNENNKSELININGYDYIGTIIIPTLNLELPVMSNFDYERLNIAPCVYYGSLSTNDLIICGHSYKSHFKYLDNLNKNDRIVLTDAKGENHIYKVEVIEVLSPTDIEEMINNEFDLTLYTCTEDGLNRITVRCNRVYG